MSNPVATIGNSIPTPSDPSVSRKTYTAIVFQEQELLLYGENEYDPSYTTFDPSTLGQRFFIAIDLGNAVGAKPEFITQESWDSVVKLKRSAFITGRYSIMPKIFMPSRYIVDNGIVTPNVAYGAYADANAGVEAFNWTVKTLNGGAVSTTEMVKFGQIGAYFGSQYITIRAKNDATGVNNFVMELNPPPQIGGTAPVPGPQGWDAGHELVVDGAFVLLLNVVPGRPGGVDYDTLQQNPWLFKIEFGDIVMTMNGTGSMEVKYTAGPDREENKATVNLSDGKAKEGPPQQEHVDEKTPYVIVVYPVWNGVIIMSGNQESSEVVNVATTFVPMRKGRSVLVDPYSSGFDPANPAPVVVGTGAGATNTIPNFGTKMTVTASNVKFDIAYLPAFFSRSMWFDEWFVANDDVPGVVDYSFAVYPIWTANGTSALLDPLTAIQSATVGPVTDTSYWYVKWRMEMDAHDRYAGEVLGSIFEITEQRDFPIKNGNGNFNLLWTGGSPGDPSPTGDWRDYVQSISVSVGIEGSSGSVSVDKYGVAGQNASAIQSIGAITIAMTGGFGTVAGSIYQGLAMGVSENISADGASWEIPLVGLEKKMDDIALINVPFLDGESATTAIRFLTRYAGLIADFSNAPNAPNHFLSASEDVNVARFDWKSGTSVKTAMDDVMNDLQYNYVVRDGVVYIYELDFTGLPVFTGPDRSGPYSEVNIISQDQTPDFDVLRNEILVIGLEAVPEGTGTDIASIPTFPRFEKRTTATTPDVPWAKSVVRPIPGTLTLAEISDIADKTQAETRNYFISGRTTIPGNANIKPYDKWGTYVIINVTHNIDFGAKTWTTDLEFATGA